MANSKTNSNQIDRLSNLPYALLLTILSFLPTHIAARTSVLCRSFRHLWKASPSLAFISEDLPYPQPEKDNFVAMAERALLCRNPYHPLLSLHLEISRCDRRNASFLCSLLTKARCLELRHLTIEGFWYADFSTILPIILTMTTLRWLSLDRVPALEYGLSCRDYPKFKFPSKISLTCLRTLSLGLVRTDLEHFNPLFSQLCCLEDLHLDVNLSHGLSISSQTIKKLKLIISLSFRQHHNVVLSLPSLESLHLETQHSVRSLSNIHGDVPLLKKVVINLYDLDERDVSAVSGLLNWISHVEELRLYAKESRDVKDPIPILLEYGKDVPKFSNLKHLDVTLCFHEHNFEAVLRMLHNCPVLESLKLFHEIL
ncbi:F-box/FBD/LRR-repeat protein At5g53840-like [Carex rostrata]